MLSMSMLLQNAAKPFFDLAPLQELLRLPPHCFRHPLLAVNFPPLFSLFSTHSPASFSPTFTVFLIFSCLSSTLLLLITPFLSSSLPGQVITKPCLVEYSGNMERRGRSLVYAYGTKGDDERIRCFVWMT